MSSTSFELGAGIVEVLLSRRRANDPADVTSSQIQVVIAGVVVANFQWWMTLLLATFGIMASRRLKKAHKQSVRAYTANATPMRRANYFNRVATRPDAAKELRVFGHLRHRIRIRIRIRDRFRCRCDLERRETTPRRAWWASSATSSMGHFRCEYRSKCSHA